MLSIRFTLFSSLFLAGSLLSAAVVQASTPQQALQQKLSAISTFSASFNQQVTDQQQQILQQGKGRLLLKQPALFRFETTEPEVNLFIGDGKSLWYYNELLEQLTIYDAATEVNRTPFVLLTSKDPALWAEYDVEQQNQQFIIRSKDSNSPVQRLTLRFDGDALSQMQVLDMNQQQSQFEFVSVQLNVPLDDELFRFDSTDNIDVDDQRQR